MVAMVAMVEVIVTETGMKEKGTRRKVASGTRAQAGISTERLNPMALSS
jgi:hypothetical protein